MQRTTLFFNGPGQVTIREEVLSPPATEQVLVQTLLSAISPGTEMLIYQGLFPTDLTLDENISELSGTFQYPTKYGYALVGRVIETGSAVEPGWKNRLVFSFHPHESHFLALPGELMPLPGDLAVEEAVFLPNMETAVNFVMDGAPLIGERALVFGQGIVGLLTTALLAQFPLGRLATLDRFPLRRQASLEVGAQASLDPGAPDIVEQIQDLFPNGADLIYEVSGAPAALDQAIAAAGFASRIVAGSWYGEKRVNLDLGGRFHRDRVRLISSQVSTLAPELSGRWTKERRFGVAWEMIRILRPSRFITHRFSISQAAEAYRLLEQNPEEAIQIVFTYQDI